MSKRYINDNPLSGLVPKGKKVITKKESFSSEDLKLIFSQPHFKTRNLEITWRYWVPILALYTGARLEELAQLSGEDIKKENNIYFFRIHDNGNNQLKNESSRRIIPVHNDLIELNFLSLVESRDDQRLFELNKVGGKYGKRVTKWFTKFKQRLGFDPSKVFHSFRHTFRDLAVESGVPSEHIKAILGHAQGDMTHGIYGSGFSLKLLNESMQEV